MLRLKRGNVATARARGGAVVSDVARGGSGGCSRALEHLTRGSSRAGRRRVERRRVKGGPEGRDDVTPPSRRYTRRRALNGNASERIVGRMPHSRWTSFVADPERPRILHEDGNPAHRLRVEHDRGIGIEAGLFTLDGADALLAAPWAPRVRRGLVEVIYEHDDRAAVELARARGPACDTATRARTGPSWTPAWPPAVTSGLASRTRSSGAAAAPRRRTPSRSPESPLPPATGR